MNFHKEKRDEILKQDLHGAVEDTTKTNPIFEDLVDLNNGIVGFLGSTIGHIIYMKYHIRHLSVSPTTTNTHNPQRTKIPNFTQPHFTFLSLNAIHLSGSLYLSIK